MEVGMSRLWSTARELRKPIIALAREYTVSCIDPRLNNPALMSAIIDQVAGPDSVDTGLKHWARSAATLYSSTDLEKNVEVIKALAKGHEQESRGPYHVLWLTHTDCAAVKIACGNHDSRLAAELKGLIDLPDDELCFDYDKYTLEGADSLRREISDLISAGKVEINAVLVDHENDRCIEFSEDGAKRELEGIRPSSYVESARGR